MVATVCLNPCIDRTVEIDALCVGGLNRVRASRIDPAGKGINVAIALSGLGMPAAAMGPMYRDNGAVIADNAAAQGVDCRFLWQAGAVRVNLKVADRASGVVTEVNEAGCAVDAALIDALCAQAEALSEESRYLVLSGSLPPGCPRDIYRRMARASRCPVVLDAEGDALAFGLEAHPFLVKPNAHELSLWAGRALSTLSEIREAALALSAQADIVAVSLGGDGALITDGAQVLFAPKLDVPVRSTVGAGDAMVAGLIAAHARGEGLAGMLRCGTAAAAATVVCDGACQMDMDAYARLLEEVALRAL